MVLLRYDSYDIGFQFSGLSLILAILFLAWGVLNIILFFKLWKACDNIKYISNNFHKASHPLSWRDLLMLGQREEAAKLVIRSLIDKLNSIYIYNSGVANNPTIEDDAKAEKEINLAKMQLEKIGVGTLPEQISSVANFKKWIAETKL